MYSGSCALIVVLLVLSLSDINIHTRWRTRCLALYFSFAPQVDYWSVPASAAWLAHLQAGTDVCALYGLMDANPQWFNICGRSRRLHERKVPFEMANNSHVKVWWVDWIHWKWRTWKCKTKRPFVDSKQSTTVNCMQSYTISNALNKNVTTYRKVMFVTQYRA